MASLTHLPVVYLTSKWVLHTQLVGKNNIFWCSHLLRKKRKKEKKKKRKKEKRGKTECMQIRGKKKLEVVAQLSKTPIFSNSNKKSVPLRSQFQIPLKAEDIFPKR